MSSGSVIGGIKLLLNINMSSSPWLAPIVHILGTNNYLYAPRQVIDIWIQLYTKIHIRWGSKHFNEGILAVMGIVVIVHGVVAVFAQ